MIRLLKMTKRMIKRKEILEQMTKTTLSTERKVSRYCGLSSESINGSFTWSYF